MHTLRRSRSSTSQCPLPLAKKLVLLGDASSGKTHLLYRLRHNDYPIDYTRLISNELHEYEKFEDPYRVRLMLVDTNVHYDRLFPLFCASTDVVLMCLSIDSRESLDKLLNFWKPEVLDKHCAGAPIILLGTKADLRAHHDNDSGRVIARDDAVRAAQAIGAVGYMECSAKLDEGVREAFDAALKLAVRAAKGATADRRKSKCSIS